MEAGAFRVLAALIGCAPIVGCSAGDGRSVAEAPTGRLVIVGGALDEGNALVWQAVLEGRDGAGRLCVIPTASGEPESSMRSAVETLDLHGGEGVAMGIRIAGGETAVADDPAMAASLLACSGYWFTGGSQSRITETFLPGGTPTAALDAIRLRFREGAVVAGTSAGAAMMSRWMIAGGSSEEALRVGVTGGDAASSDPGPGADGEGVWIREGLRFFDSGVLDQHFLARGRIGRLLAAVLEHPGIAVGFGIDENTAMIVDGPSARVVGESGVVVVDGRDGDPADAARELTVSLAGSGDRIDLLSVDVRLASGKRPLVAGDVALPEQPILEPWIFPRALYAFSRRPDVGVVIEPVEDVVMTLEKGDGFFAVSGGGGATAEAGGGVLQEGPAGVPTGFSAGPFRVRVERR